jgi:polygalacturonase
VLSRRRLVGLGGLAAVAAPLAGPWSIADAQSGPGDIFDVRQFGARGDGVTIDSDAINRAIRAAASTGGTVYLPAGTYASYSVRLQSKVALYLAAGATLLAASPTDAQGYDLAEPGAGNDYQDFGHGHWHNSLVWGEGVQNVTIFGPGTIDGQGLVTGGDQESAPGQGNKAIALKLCRNVAIRDITIFRAGHFGILPTGVDNFRIDGLAIDTNRDGINLDCCRNVLISNTTVNSPNDDAIVLKSSWALNAPRATENVTIDNCMVSGYDLGTLLDGTFKTGPYERTGRIKFGTESNGGFRNVAISNVVFDYCRGLALETVDGGPLEDVIVSNVTMRHVQTPLFLRLGARMRGPSDLQVGTLRRVTISGLTIHDADPRYPSTLSGIPGHPIEDVQISNVRQYVVGGYAPANAVASPPELEDGYPENTMFGTLPAFGFFVRHAARLGLDDVQVRFSETDTRPAFVLTDVADADVHHVRADKAEGAPTFVLDSVTDFNLSASRPVTDAQLPRVSHQEL